MLSEFGGAAHELTRALSLNPYAIGDCANPPAAALQMPSEEQRARMRAMRAVVEEFNSYRWAADMSADTVRLRMQAQPTIIA
jgi:trehalose-6-phosphate synthase